MMWETGKDESLTCHKGGVIEEVRYLSIPTSHPDNLLIPHYNHTEPPMNPQSNHTEPPTDITRCYNKFNMFVQSLWGSIPHHPLY